MLVWFRFSATSGAGRRGRFEAHFAVADDIVGAIFGFEVGFGEIFADDAEEEKLDATEKSNQADQAGPAGNWVAKNECADNNYDNKNEGSDTKEDAEKG